LIISAIGGEDIEARDPSKTKILNVPRCAFYDKKQIKTVKI
jgi:hypothetical protein